MDTFGFPLRRLRILVLTFNMNRKQQIFEMNKLFADPDAYDMIIIGGQEAKMSQKTSIIIEFANYLGSYNFMTINSVVMWEMVRLNKANIRFMILQPHASADTILRVQAMAANLYRAAWAWLICVAVTVVVSYCTKPTPEAQLTGLVYGSTIIPHDGSRNIFEKPIFWAIVVATVLFILNLWLW